MYLAQVQVQAPQHLHDETLQCDKKKEVLDKHKTSTFTEGLLQPRCDYCMTELPSFVAFASFLSLSSKGGEGKRYGTVRLHLMGDFEVFSHLRRSKDLHLPTRTDEWWEALRKNTF